MDGMAGAFFRENPKTINKHHLLDLVRFTSEGISRAELARKLNLSRSAVTSIVNDLIQAGILREARFLPIATGRRPVDLEVNPSLGYVIGVDLGVTHLSLVLSDCSASVVHEIEVPFDLSIGPEASLQKTHAWVSKLLEQAGVSMDQILTVGVGVPGPVVTERGEVIAPPVMPGWDDYPIRDELEDRWSCPVSLNNDAELGALGEWAYGAGRDDSNVIYIKVGTGIGAGLLLDNRIYRGATGTAGEIGHLTVQDQGPLCTCGNRGCLEALAGGRAIAQNARRAVASGHRTQLAEIKPVEKITAKSVTLAARRGDLTSQQILSDAGTYIGTAIAGSMNLLNPGIVIVGGGVSQAGDLILEPLRKAARERSLKAASTGVRITAAVLGRRSTSMGAVVQALNYILHHHIENRTVQALN